MKTAKLGALFLISIMALTGIGAGYAQWTDSVAIDATATTGDVELRITDFGVCSESAGATWTGIGNWGEAESITITIDDTYPGWWAYVCIQVKNTGTITIKMYSTQINYVAGHAGLMDYYRHAIPTGNVWCQMAAPIYWLNTFTWWSTERTHEGLGLPTITIAPGATAVLGGYFELDPNTPQGYENTALTVEITLKAIQAVP